MNTTTAVFRPTTTRLKRRADAREVLSEALDRVCAITKMPRASVMSDLNIKRVAEARRLFVYVASEIERIAHPDTSHFIGRAAPTIYNIVEKVGDAPFSQYKAFFEAYDARKTANGKEVARA
jgi:hypothetical protein